MQHLDVSVVVPSYNSNVTLVRCLISAASQMPPPLEIIVVDDGSDDSPIDQIIEVRHRFDVPIRLLSQKNMGAADARNAGISASKGKYIAFLDSDDIWFPSKLYTQYKVMEMMSWKICGHGYMFDISDRTDHMVDVECRTVKYKSISRHRFILGNPYFTPTVMVLKNSFKGFDSSFRRVDDYKAWLENFSPNHLGYIYCTMAAGYKQPIGASGLTESIDIMHQSYLDVLKMLHAENVISLKFYIAAKFIESLKLPLRKFKYYFANRIK